MALLQKFAESGKSILETICAYANEPHQGGGYIFLDVAKIAGDEIPSYQAIGVLKIFIPQAQHSLKPIYFRKVEALEASQQLKELRNLGLVKKEAKGNAIYRTTKKAKSIGSA